METILDIVAGTGVVLFLLATAFIERAWGRVLLVALTAAAVYALHPLAVQQSLSAFIDSLDSADILTLAAVLTLDGVIGCAGATLLLRAGHGHPPRWFRRLAAQQVGVVPLLALFYLELKAFHTATGWSFEATAVALCLAIVAAGLAASEALRRLLPDRDLLAELRLLVHVGQVALAAGLTAFALQGTAANAAVAVEARPHGVVAGVAAAGMLCGYWSHRRRLATHGTTQGFTTGR